MKTGNTFLWFYYDKSRKEIDTVIKDERGYIGIEVKYQGQADEKSIKRITPIKKYFILSKEDIGGKGELLIVSVDIFLALLPVSERNV